MELKTVLNLLSIIKMFKIHLVILNRLLNFIDDYSDDMILGDTCLLVSKYSPFVKKDTKTLTDKHESLINIIARQRVLSNTNNIT